MTACYQEILQSLRKAFPQPGSEPAHDDYLVSAIVRTLDRVNLLETHPPIEPDYQAARRGRINDDGISLDAVMRQLVDTFDAAVTRRQDTLSPNPSIASILGMLLPALYNPNLCSDESGGRCSEAEVRVSAMAADLVGYDAQRAGGVFTFGGTGGLLYGLKVGLEKAVPGSSQAGIRNDVVVLASEQGHYSCYTAAAWLGIGQNHVVAVPTDDDNSMQLAALEKAARNSLAAGQRIAAIVATMGSTDAFGIDDLAGIHALRQRLMEEFSLDYRPHIHADAVIGWAWSVFNDYDFAANPLCFRARTLRALAAAQDRMAALRLADSIGIDFHKTGYTPYISSLVLFGDAADLERIARSRDKMPYLYQSGQHHPGVFTLETSRSAAGPLAALANLLLLAKQGYRTLLGHAVEMDSVLREAIESSSSLVVLNDDNVGPVTLFRAYPDGVDTSTVVERERGDPNFRDRLLEHNQYNRRLIERIRVEALAGRETTISFTDCYRRTDYGEPIVALKSCVLSPLAEEGHMRSLVQYVLAAREEL